MTAVEFIEHLHAENEAFYRDARGRGALRDLQVVFPVPWIYLAELVQNAIDARATRIRFAPGPGGSLVVEHNGNPFSEEDVHALCTRGVSTKSTNTVGFMGVGFKSVFKIYEQVVISSGDWTFQLCVPSDDVFGVRQWIGAVLPIWAADAVPPGEGFTCRFELSRRVDTGTCAADLAELLREGEALLPLLAWNRVSTLEVAERTWTLSTTEVPVGGGDSSRVRIDVILRGDQQRSWILFARSYQPSESAVLRFLRHRQIQPTPEEREAVLVKARRLRDVVVFCELAPDGSPRPVNRGQCFSLVPTGQSTCLGLHLQAEWLLDISRREPMRILGDPWQEEILAQVPDLLKAYLEWMTSDETDDVPGWSDGYNALPGPAAGTEIDAALRAGGVADRFRRLLGDSVFVPYEAPDDRIDFATPVEARALPAALQGFVDQHGSSRELFGPRVIAHQSLGKRATAFLDELGLVRQLAPEEVESEWDAGKVAEWYKACGEGAGAAHVRLLGALAALDTEPAWAAAALRCLPAADGGWRPRRNLRRYPPNWGILGPAPAVAAALAPFVGAAAGLLDWTGDQLIRRDPSAEAYLAPLGISSLEHVAARWWQGLPPELTPTDRELVIAFTDLVRRQKTLPRLVPKVLAVGGNGERLLPIGEAILADPYIGNYRRDLFPGHPTVSGEYLTAISDATNADWLAFFESQTPAPKGRPILFVVKSSASPEDRRLVSLSDRRRTYKTADWNGVKVDSSDYHLVDTQWPPEVAHVRIQPADLSGQALQRWMVERPGFFGNWRQPSIVYILYGSSGVASVTVPRDAEWLAQLKACRWLFDHEGVGPYRPAEVLSACDASRPEAPVARLVEGFAALAKTLGIDFGGAIPNAPAIDRLRALGPSASWPTLSELLRDAISEAGGDETKSDLLRSVLNHAPLFALPTGRRTPDGHSRVGAGRLVLKGRRSSLGDWVCCCDEFPEAGPERDVLQQLSSVLTVPESTTPEQAVAFLRWVWANEPEADAVRQVLPRALQYALEAQEDSRASLRLQAKVFATARLWVRAADGKVVLNDLGISDRELLEADEGVLLATPGHLGEDDPGRYRACELLGLERASRRYRVEVDEYIGGAVTSDVRRSGFDEAQRRFWWKLKATDEETTQESDPPPALELVCVDTITQRLVKDGQELDARDSAVAIRDGRAYAVGEPPEFAANLAEALMEHWGITLRRDGYALGCQLTSTLARIDDLPIDAQPEGTVASGEQGGGKPPGIKPDKADKPNAGGEGGGPTSDPKPEETGARGGAGSSHTTRHRDALQVWLLRRHKEAKQRLKDLERQIAEGLGADARTPDEDDPQDDRPRRQFGEDKKYREAVALYEQRHGRFPVPTDTDQPGYDIDSYSHEDGHPDRVLARRIEVKGKGTVWTGEEIVELSDRQLRDALALKRDDGGRLAAQFDYWLYVVETFGGVLHVIPLRNPARRAAKFAFRGGLWRSEEEVEPPVDQAGPSGDQNELEHA